VITLMNPKHVLMRLGLLYLKDHGGRTAIHKLTLKEGRPLKEEIESVKISEHENYIWIWTKLS